MRDLSSDGHRAPPDRAPQLSLQAVEAFVVVAELRSFTDASKQLGDVTTSAVSRLIARLERDLGVPLLHRRRPVTLTEEGRAALPIARRLLADAHALTRLDVADQRTGS